MYTIQRDEGLLHNILGQIFNFNYFDFIKFHFPDIWFVNFMFPVAFIKFYFNFQLYFFYVTFKYIDGTHPLLEFIFKKSQFPMYLYICTPKFLIFTNLDQKKNSSNKEKKINMSKYLNTYIKNDSQVIQMIKYC